jgi:hypothetical protein
MEALCLARLCRGNQQGIKELQVFPAVSNLSEKPLDWWCWEGRLAQEKAFGESEPDLNSETAPPSRMNLVKLFCLSEPHLHTWDMEPKWLIKFTAIWDTRRE